jgi:hypothetical protein
MPNRNFNPFRHGYLFSILERDHERRLKPCAVDVFEAKDDLDAIRIACAVYQSCDDKFHGYILCKGDRVISTNENYHCGVPFYDLTICRRHREAAILALQKALFDSYECLKRSRKLIREIERRQASVNF